MDLQVVSSESSNHASYDASEQPKKSLHTPRRKAHKKSRAGCQTCKRRRVKCDEVKPECGNCSRVPMPCDYAPYLKWGEQHRTVDRTGSKPRRGRPHKDWTISGSQNRFSLQLDHTIFKLPTVFDLDSLSFSFGGVGDLELMYHYLLETSSTLGAPLLWREEIPRLAFTNHYVLRMVLAISAQHVAAMCPGKSSRYEHLADKYSVLALREVALLIPSINENNCSALYIFTVLVCFSIFARKPSPGNLLIIAEDGEASMWGIVRGVRYIVNNMGFTTIFSGCLKRSSLDEATEVSPLNQIVSFTPTNWEEVLMKLQEFITSKKSDTNIYQKMFDNLSWSYKFAFGGTEHYPGDETYGIFGAIMAWLYKMDDEFVYQVRSKQPIALILLAYYAVLLQNLESLWFMRGWAKHILQGVTGVLDERYCDWLGWPLVQLHRLETLRL